MVPVISCNHQAKNQLVFALIGKQDEKIPALLDTYLLIMSLNRITIIDIQLSLLVHVQNRPEQCKITHRSRSVLLTDTFTLI